MKKLTPITGKATSNCMFFTMSTLFRLYERNEYFHNAYLWNFKFESDKKKSISECLFEDDLYIDSYPYIKAVSGISFDVCKEKDLAVIYQNAIENEKPVIAHFDIYWCPWTANYQKYHYDHYFIITSYDEKTDSFECIDSFYLDKPANLPRINLEKGLLDIISHEVLAAPDTQKILPLITNCLKYRALPNKDSQMFADMMQMSNDVLELDYLKEFEDHTDVKSIPLFIKLQNINLNRVSLSFLCKYIHDFYNLNNFDEISVSFKRVSREWNMLMVMVMKYFVTKEENVLKNASSQIKKIAGIEIGIAEKINHI